MAGPGGNGWVPRVDEVVWARRVPLAAIVSKVRRTGSRQKHCRHSRHDIPVRLIPNLFS
jgi:hypothetical protein